MRQGLDAGLVDELCLTLLPVILGRGIRLWEGLQARNDLHFDPPTMHQGAMVQVTARVVRPHARAHAGQSSAASSAASSSSNSAV